MHILRFREKKSLANARKNRLEIIKAQLSRREMIRAGLIGAGGYLVLKNGLSQWASGHEAWASGGSGGSDGSGSGSGTTVVSPPTRAFIEALPIMPIHQPVTTLTGPTPTIAPNTAGGEGRTRPHQAFSAYPSHFTFPPALKFEVHQKAATVIMSPDLPPQPIWGFDGRYPAPTYYGRYGQGQDVLVRNFNDLPPNSQNGGFGMNTVSTHLHNAHTPSESDGFPCDFFAPGQFYDHHYPHALAGFGSTHVSTNGDINEALSTLWYHDHRVDFTAQNVYKGLTGFYCLYNQFDTGNETTGFRMPGVQASTNFYTQLLYDVPLMLADRVFDPTTGLLLFDLFNTDGILGDKFLVNGKIQPFFQVEPRRYRFRLLNSGPSRFYQVFLTDQGTNTQIPFWQIGTDGNLLPHPISVTNTIMGVAQRMDIIIDFKPWAGKTLYFENRMEQTDGRGPTGNTLAAGTGNFLMQFRVGTTVTHADASVDPATRPTYYSLPSTAATPRASRTFQFSRSNGMWQINGQIMSNDCSQVRLQVQQNSVEHWTLQNNSGGWMHPVHIHFEEHQIMSQNLPLLNTDVSRKDVMRLQHNETATLFFRFRDFTGRYPLHCHNVVHEDHAMMLRWDIVPAPGGDTNSNP
ncbi:MAG TPA: multicopper oxidase domain-containing protein [Kofleriaceae bacterium]